MAKKINYIPIASTVLSAALIALAIGFSAPTGEQSKLAYDGNLWCVSNYIEQEPRAYLKDGRPQADDRLKGKDDWIVREQVSAENKEEAESKARKNGGGMFDPSDKTELRSVLDKNDKKFFTTHFNKGATIAGPCLGGGSSSTYPGRWLNDAIREDCFGIKPPVQKTGAKADNVESATLSSASGGPCKDLRNTKASSEKSIYNFLKKYSSPMAGATKSIIQAAEKYKISPSLLVAISFQESSLGTKGRGARNKNPGNIKASRSSMLSQGITPVGSDNQRHTIFASWDDGFAGLAHVLNKTYLSKGRTTLPKIAEIYLEGNKNEWVSTVDKILGDLCK